MVGLDSEIISKRSIRCVSERAQDPQSTEYLSWYLNDESLLNVNKIEVADKYITYRFSFRHY